MTATLIVMAKPPELGKVKTRLADDIGQEPALAVYKHLLNYTLLMAANSKLETKVFAAWEPELPVFAPRKVHLQEGADLGARMTHAFQQVNGPALLIGTDCPAIDTAHLHQACALLDQVDVVFGPARDGGYYLVAMRSPHPEIFEGVSWSTEHVLQQSIERCEQNNLSHHLLEALSDIDTFTDLKASGFVPELVDLLNGKP